MNLQKKYEKLQQNIGPAAGRILSYGQNTHTQKYVLLLLHYKDITFLIKQVVTKTALGKSLNEILDERIPGKYLENTWKITFCLYIHQSLCLFLSLKVSLTTGKSF